MSEFQLASFDRIADWVIRDRSPPLNGNGPEGDNEGRRYDDDGDSSDEDKDHMPKP